MSDKKLEQYLSDIAEALWFTKSSLAEYQKHRLMDVIEKIEKETIDLYEKQRSQDTSNKTGAF